MNNLSWATVSEGPWSRRRKHQAVVWYDKLLLLGGFDGESALDLNDVWSWDGDRWTLITEHAGWSGRDGHCAVVLNGSIFVIGGTDDPYYCQSDVWRSDDGGLMWRQLCQNAPWPERWQHASCVHNDYIYISGGWGGSYLNDIWRSSDGINWTRICENCPWKPRMFHSAISFNGALYIIGGHDGRMQLNDVWGSSDGGFSWVQVCNSAEWDRRQGHVAVAYDGVVYLMGGFGGSNRYNDLWKSSDCAHWTIVTRQCTWSPRQGHACVVYRGALSLLGGFDESGYCNNMFCISVAAIQGSKYVDSSNSLDQPIKTSKVLTVTLTCVLDMISKLKQKRNERESLIQKLVNILALVMSSANFESINNYLLKKSNNENNVKIDITTDDKQPRRLSKKLSFKNYENLINERSFTDFSSKSNINNARNKLTISVPNDSGIENNRMIKSNNSPVFKMLKLDIANIKEIKKYETTESEVIGPPNDSIASFSPRIRQILKASREGSPLRETIKTQSKSRPTSARMQRINSNEDLRMGFWTSLKATSSPLQSSRKSSLSISIIPDNSISQSRYDLNYKDKDIVTKVNHDSSNIKSNDSNSTSLPITQDPMNANWQIDGKGLDTNRSSSQYYDCKHTDDDLENSLFSISSISSDDNDVYDNIDDIDIAVDDNPFVDTEVTSAMLREQMEEEQKKLNKIQKQIKILSENLVSIRINKTNEPKESDLLDHINLCIKERTDLCSSAVIKAKKLIQHIMIIRKMQNRRNLHFNEVTRKLEKYLRQSGIDPETEQSPICSCSWEEWQEYVQRGADVLNEINSITADIEISTLSNLMKKKADLCSKISEWIENVNNNDFSWSDSLEDRLANNTGSFDKPMEIVGISNDIQSDESIFKESVQKFRSEKSLEQLKSYEDLLNEYQSVLNLLDVSRMNVKSLIDSEINLIDETQQKTKDLVNQSLLKGYSLIRGLSMQIRVDIVEISAMKSEVLTWYEKCVKLRNYKKLKQACEEITSENTIREENLIQLEDRRIDIKSSIEKASLRKHRGGFSPRSLNRSLSSDETESSIDKLKVIEQEVRDYRKDFRKFYREIKKFALEYAPELFYSLPDLSIPGSILGDGGFSESIKLPKRRFEEYENIKPLIETTTGTNKNSRHLLLQGVYDNELVVLKGFILTDNEQRKGFEREISILTRLNNDCIISPKAIVEGIGIHETYIEYSYYKGGNLYNWLNDGARKPWEMQGIARQLLYGINYLHDHNIVHKDIKPSNVLMHEDGRVVLTDFELSRDVSGINGDFVSTQVRVGTKGFMAPEVESGHSATFASDMYSYGVLIFFMYFPNKFHELIPGFISIPSNDIELSDLLVKLLDVNPLNRPTANNALMHRYFRITYVERLLSEGEIVEQDRKLEAVRSVLYHSRMENKSNIEVLTVHRSNIVADVLRYFRSLPLDKMKYHLRIIFINEPGIDEGGLLNELFSLFFDLIFQDTSMFESCDSKANDYGLIAGADSEQDTNIQSNIFLPTTKETNETLENLKAFGRILVKTLYEGRRIGNRLCPSVFKFITSTNPNMRDLQIYDPQTAKSLQWVLATVGVEDFGLHFESVNQPELGVVDDSNKSKFVLLKIHNILIESRRKQLVAVKEGFLEGIRAFSEDASPFLSLLSHTDWRVLLCGDLTISPQRVVSLLKYHNFPKKSLIPTWLNEIILSSSEDHLRQFLVFVTGIGLIVVNF